ncbi:MAG TPA: site-specific DNA-methyltransferase, partial [Gemmatimonadales bacterium]|nr:site-specific DNA-methyltransferase [Gemmatimonadales bacterium]
SRIEMSDADREVIDNMGGYGTVEGYTPNDVYGPYGPVQSAAHQDGRWPANVALAHHPDCKEVGTRKVPTGTAVNRNHEPGSVKPGAVGPTGLRNQTEDVTYGTDGTETIPAYECVRGCPVAMLDEQSGERPSTGTPDRPAKPGTTESAGYGFWAGKGVQGPLYNDEGGASRFFYTSKASREERNAGLDSFEDRPGPSEDYGTKAQHPMKPEGEPNLVLPTKNPHPTVKNIDLMRWLVKMVTPPGGLVLDPFTGSGSTGCAAVLDGFDFLGIEREDDYVQIARARIAFWADQQADDVATILAGERRAREHRERGQLTLG